MPLSERYRRQVALLIAVMPFVAAEKDFALKGGTAINLCVRADWRKCLFPPMACHSRHNPRPRHVRKKSARLVTGRPRCVRLLQLPCCSNRRLEGRRMSTLVNNERTI